MTRPAWVDRANQTNRPETPPRSGRGATTEAWRAYATALGYPIPDGASRAVIIAAVDAGPPPTARRASGPPKVEGDVYAATKAAVDRAEHLTAMDRAAVTVLLDLAKTIDGMDQRPSTAPFDNVTVPMFLRYAEALGLTPAARSKLNMKPVESDSKLAQLRAIRGGRAVGE